MSKNSSGNWAFLIPEITGSTFVYATATTWVKCRMIKLNISFPLVATCETLFCMIQNCKSHYSLLTSVKKWSIVLQRTSEKSRGQATAGSSDVQSLTPFMSFTRARLPYRCIFFLTHNPGILSWSLNIQILTQLKDFALTKVFQLLAVSEIIHLSLWDAFW